MRTARIDLYTDSEGKWRWRYVSSNGRTLADSGQGYWRKETAINGLELVLNGHLAVHTTWVEFNRSHIVEDPIIVRVLP